MYSNTVLSLFRKLWFMILILSGVVGLVSWKGFSLNKQSVIWRLDNPEVVGGYKTTVLGSPQVVRDQTGTSLFFDGVDDGLILPINPVAGWKQFTIELLFKPAADGPTAPRFLHFQDSIDNRGTIEARITPQGRWYTDTFLKNGKSNERLTLIDSLQQHPCDQWYWVALVYDGKEMSHYVNGIKELKGALKLEPMNEGRISLGVRLNKVSWFKGQMREVRFHPVALKEKELRR